MVSIIIPTYNRSALLAEAIQSCISQTYRPIECIVVDDGSTDNTQEIVQIMQNSIDEEFTLKYIFQPNSGSQVARNKGTAIAKGQFIQYLDSDDLLYPNKINQQILYFKDHSFCDAVYGDWEVGSQKNNTVSFGYKTEDLISQFLTEKCIANFSVLMRSELVRKIGDWDIKIKRNQEVDFHLRAVMAGAHFSYLSGINGLWRTHEGKRIVTETGLLQIVQFYQKWENILEEKEMFTDNLKNRIANLYMWLLSQNKNSKISDVIIMLKEAIRLNPDKDFLINRKLRFLINVIGTDRALKIWWYKFRILNSVNK
jgi:glycosyltransferase involved in cell wall biosynthesis